MQVREPNRRRQRQTNQHHGRPPPPPPTKQRPDLDAPGHRHGQQPRLRDGRPPGVVKQDKSSRGCVDTTTTRSDPQRIRMSKCERPIGAAKGKQSDTEASCQPLPSAAQVTVYLNPSQSMFATYTGGLSCFLVMFVFYAADKLFAFMDSYALATGAPSIRVPCPCSLPMPRRHLHAAAARGLVVVATVENNFVRGLGSVGLGLGSRQRQCSTACVTLPHRHDWVPTFGCLVSQPPRLLTIPEALARGRYRRAFVYRSRAPWA